MKNIFHIIYDGVEALDFTGPHDVFAMANYVTGMEGNEEFPFKQYTVAQSITHPIKTAGGISILPDYSFDDEIPDVDLIVIPGSPGIRAINKDDSLIGWIQSHYNPDNPIVSVCLGAFPLIVALVNKLDGSCLTTHQMSIGQFEKKLVELGIDASVAVGVRYVRSQNVFCSAGVSAGIDLAFYIVETLLGVEKARCIAKIMEYNRTINWDLDPSLGTRNNLKTIYH
jgi:transcriptional regulator GlxA family with amidase domain